MKKQITIAVVLLAVFLIAYFLPVSNPTVQRGIIEAFKMLQWYAVYHTLACVIPAIFIAGAIATFLDKGTILRHLGPKANPIEAYGLSSISGILLAVCSCSVLPMFAGIYRIGAGLGPASTFLFSGPALNIMAIFLTARVLGWELGVARTLAAIGGSILVGLCMAGLFYKSEQKRAESIMQLPDLPESKRSLWQTAAFIGVMIAFLIFSDWANPGTKIITLNKDATVTRLESNNQPETVTIGHNTKLDVSVVEQTWGDMTVQVQNTLMGSELFEPGTRLNILSDQIVGIDNNVPAAYQWAANIYQVRWYFAWFCFGVLMIMLWRWFDREEISDWLNQSWSFAQTIIPLLFGGVFVTGFVATLIPAEIVARWVGGNSLSANFIASLIGSLWYFATLTEIPCMQALLELGMGKGPALALLLAGPTLSLPSIIVIGRFLGLQKTVVFVALVIIFSSLIGMGFGALY